MKKLLFTCAAAVLAGAALAATPPAADFFDKPSFDGATISPSGRYIAMRTVADKNGRVILMVFDTETQKMSVAARMPTSDVASYMWINDHRLAFTADELQLGLQSRAHAPGLWAVNIDGENLVQLAAQYKNIAVNRDRKLLPHETTMFAHAGAQDSDWMYVMTTGRDGRYPEPLLMRLNTVTREVERVALPGDARSGVLDESGEPRFAATQGNDDPTITIHFKDGPAGAWRTLTTFNPYKDRSDGITPLAMTRDGVLYVRSRKGEDKLAVYTYDTKTSRISEQAAIKMEKHDFEGELVIRDGKLRGIRYTGDEEGTQWLDPEYKAMQDEIDKQMPATINNLQFPLNGKAQNVLVVSYSDTQPEATWLFNRSTRKLTLVGQSRPQIKPAQMGEQGVVRYKARDGMEIPALLTMPPGSAGKPAPMVVLVHGGPWVRGKKWGWNPDRQFLASRGYAVLEPDFRGSKGFGLKHLEAGFKQWGLKMQDDLADGVKWAAAQGYADPKRVCIAGGSYGGYAALMGMVNNSDLYQCAISFVGVTDINLLYNGHWIYHDDVSDIHKKYGMPDMIGDPVKDAAQLKATSPLEQAARITKPVLLAYGSKDERVPLVHGLRFRDAVKQGNKDVEWVEYEGEGHGFVLPANRIDFWSRVERLLGRTIGPGLQP